MRKKVLWITETAVMLALLVTLQALTKPMGQLVTGSCVNAVLAIAVLLFGFATVICWSHYGAECIRYLTASHGAQTIYRIATCAAVFLGAHLSPDSLWDAADFALGTMTLINLFVLILARREIERETERYFMC